MTDPSDIYAQTEANHDMYTAAYRCPGCGGYLLSMNVNASDDAPACEACFEDCDGEPLVPVPVLEVLAR